MRDYRHFQRTRPKLKLPFLAEARERAGLYKEDLALMAKISVRTIYYAEHGMPVTRPVAYKLFNALQRKFCELGVPFPFSEHDMPTINPVV